MSTLVMTDRRGTRLNCWNTMAQRPRHSRSARPFSAQTSICAPATQDAPKCFARIRGKRILDWTLEALAAGGATEFCFIGGYRMEAVQREYPQFIFRRNEDWENNNILVSLMCAEDLMDRPFVTA